MVMLSSMTGCGKKGEESPPVSEEPTTTYEEPTEEPTEATEEPTDEKYLIPEKSSITISQCEGVINDFLNACKNGDIETIIESTDSSYYIKNWTENKNELSSLLKYMFSDIKWKFNLDDMEVINQELIDEYSLEKTGIMKMHVAFVYRPWKYSREAYLSALNSKKEFSIPSAATAEQMYDCLDMAKEKLPYMFSDTIDLTYTTDGIKVKADNFFNNFFRDAQIFGNSLEKEKYIQYMLGGNDEVYIQPTKNFFDKNAAEDNSKVFLEAFNILKKRTDTELPAVIKKAGDSVKNTIDKESLYQDIKKLKADDLEIIAAHLSHIYQFGYDIEGKVSENRQAELIRFYNVPSDFYMTEVPEFIEYIYGYGAYYHVYQYVPDDYNIEKSAEMIKVLCDFYNGIHKYMKRYGLENMGDVPVSALSEPQLPTDVPEETTAAPTTTPEDETTTGTGDGNEQPTTTGDKEKEDTTEVTEPEVMF